MKLVVIGAGAMGRWCVKGLGLAADVDEIVVGDIDVERARQVAEAEGAGKARHLRVDASDTDAVARALAGCDAVINAAQHTCVLTGMEGALKARVPYTDLGGFFHLTRRQFEWHERFRAAGVPAVIAMGSAPGITNILAKYAADRLDVVEEVHARCGSVDRTDWSGYGGWTVPYSIETLSDEFTAPAVQWVDGAWHEYEGASGEEDCDFGPPLGTLRAYFTLHSEVATFTHSWCGQGLRAATWKLALPPSFTEEMRFLARLGMTSKEDLEVDETVVKPRRVLAALLTAMPQPEVVPDDVEVLMAIVRGRSEGRRVEWRVRAVVPAAPSLGGAAGDVDTGIPPTIVARALARGEIEKPGVWAPEQVAEPDRFFAELRTWGIVTEATRRESLGGEQPQDWDSSDAVPLTASLETS